MSIIIKSKVIKGCGVGMELGFPTANLNVGLKEFKKLDFGVYSCEVFLHISPFDKGGLRGILHYGQRKTFNKEISAEVLILNFEGDLYNKEIEVTINKKIRNIEKFSSRKKLIEQIKKDIDKVKS